MLIRENIEATGLLPAICARSQSVLTTGKLALVGLSNTALSVWPSQLLNAGVVLVAVLMASVGK